MNNDFLITTLSRTGHIHGYFCRTAQTCTELQKNHRMNNISSALFSRALTSAVLLSGNLKNRGDVLSLKWNCTGPVGQIFIEVNESGQVRGNIGNAQLDFVEGSLNGDSILSEPYIGFGELVVSRISPVQKTPYHSVTVIETGEIASDISIYLDQSLQIRSALKLGLSITPDNLIETAGGILLMALPNAIEEELEKLENAFQNISSFTDLLKNPLKADAFFKDYFDQLDMEIVSRRPVGFYCSCSRETVFHILKKHSRKELAEYLDDEGRISADCQYCGKSYPFNIAELENSDDN